jgi:putative polymerase
VLLALATHGVHYSDSFLGRLMLTGRTLMRMDGPELLGLRGDLPSYADMGYPYVVANFGILGCLALWGALWHLPVAGATGQRFRVAVALYLSLILCVSGTSVFAFKTSAILWFLLGTLAAPDTRAAPGGAR